MSYVRASRAAVSERASMSMRFLTVSRPAPAPLSGTFLSVTAHAAMLVAVAAGGGPAGDGGAPTSPPPGLTDERLHWVGLGPGGDDESPRPGRPGLRPPIAYVVPGRGAPGLRASAGDGARDRAAGRGGPRATDGKADGSGDTPAGAARPANPGHAPVRFATPAVPDVALPDAAEAILVAGVLSAAPDNARRATRPEDFAVQPASNMLAEMLVRTGSRVGVGPRLDLQPRDLPIPFAGNPVPPYPAELARAHVGGHVVVEFRIDSTGVVDTESLRVVTSTDVRFTDAVRGVLPRLRFAPAERGARAVGVTVLQPFLFTVRDTR
jgi:TonB family protein